ncbi:MAG TPA: diguanylate cyclase [Candidatus Atribacteria bacterium]|nr:diguanylate cyclase [Candidatus Atribacteria bacterium]
MKDKDKIKEQWQNKLMKSRQQITRLENLKTNHGEKENKLAKFEKMYFLITENTSDVISLHDLNLQATFIYINPSIKENTGYKPEELLGKSPFEFIHPDDRKNLLLILKDYVDTKIRKFLNVKELPSTKRIEFRFRDKRGNWRYFQSTVNIVTDQLLIVSRDITAGKKVEEKIRQSEKKYHNLFENMPGAYYRTDKDGNLIMINPEGAKLFGYNSPKDIIGKNIAQHFYFSPEKRKKYLKELEKNKGNLKDFELTLKKKDGTPLIISDTSHYYYDKEGNIAGVEGIFVDISERKENEKLQQVLYNISKAANSPISLDELYKSIHQELSTIIDTTNFNIALLSKDKKRIRYDYFIDEKDDVSITLEYDNIGTLSAYIIKTGQPLLANRQQIDRMIKKGELILSHLGTLTEETVWLGVPLKIEDKVIGTMAVLSYTNPHLYSEKDIKLMEFVSSQVAMAIERKRVEERIRYLSFHDILTGLYNRAYFEEELKRYDSSRYYPLSIVMIDVNRLKVVNDTFGHQEGDRLLKHLSQLLTSVSRQGDILARIGGDEFAILLPSTTSEEVQKFCERVKKTCLQDKITPVYLRPNIALGYITQNEEHKDINSLFREADRNMYKDKFFNSKIRKKHFL